MNKKLGAAFAVVMMIGVAFATIAAIPFQESVSSEGIESVKYDRTETINWGDAFTYDPKLDTNYEVKISGDKNVISAGIKVQFKDKSDNIATGREYSKGLAGDLIYLDNVRPQSICDEVSIIIKVYKVDDKTVPVKTVKLIVTFKNHCDRVESGMTINVKETQYGSIYTDGFKEAGEIVSNVSVDRGTNGIKDLIQIDKTNGKLTFETVPSVGTYVLYLSLNYYSGKELAHTDCLHKIIITVIDCEHIGNLFTETFPQLTIDDVKNTVSYPIAGAKSAEKYELTSEVSNMTMSEDGVVEFTDIGKYTFDVIAHHCGTTTSKEVTIEVICDRTHNPFNSEKNGSVTIGKTTEVLDVRIDPNIGGKFELSEEYTGLILENGILKTTPEFNENNYKDNQQLPVAVKHTSEDGCETLETFNITVIVERAPPVIPDEPSIGEQIEPPTNGCVVRPM